MSRRLAFAKREMVGHTDRRCAKTPFWSHLWIKTRSFYQDRLGTNIGKVEKKTATTLMVGHTDRRTDLVSQMLKGAIKPPFWSRFYAQNDHFTQTGSGQT